MANAQSKLDILINARNQSGPVVNQLKGDLKQLDKSAGNLARGLGGLAAGVGVAGLVALGGAAAGAAMEMSRLSAQSQDVEASMQSLASQGGESASAMLAGIKEASRGAISDYDLMLTANRAMLLGVAQNTDEMVALMDVARARSQAMGMTTADAFGDIVTGIGRMSPMILDNLGIVVDAERANAAYAASIGKTASQLTEQEKKQALVNAVIKDSAELVRQNVDAGDDAASKFERMDAAIQNAKSALGDLFQPAMAVVAEQIARAAEAAAEGMKSLSQEAVAQRTEAAMLDQQILVLANDIGQLEQGLRRLRDAGQENSAVYQENATKLAALKAELAQVTAEYQNMIPAIQMANQDFEFTAITADQARMALGLLGDEATTTGSKMLAMGADALVAMEQFNLYLGHLRAIEGAIGGAAKSAGVLYAGEQGGSAGLMRQQQLTQQLETQVALWAAQGHSQKEIAEILLPAMISQINEADRATFRTATGTKKISEEARAAQQAFNELQGTVEGVLRGALNPGVGVDPDAMLEKLGVPRADAINESARRLADIAANGLKGQDWLGDFANDVPDIWRMIRTAQNPQEEAAHLLRDFQDGLLSSAIDRDKAKEIVRRQILGDRNMAEMAREIAAELATEMGVPLQEALSAAQGTLGGGGTGQAGTDAVKQFADGAATGMEERNVGGNIVDTAITQMRASYSRLRLAGGDGGREWATGFMAAVGEHVPTALINLLTNLVTPEVMAKFAQQGTLQGAVN